MRSSKEYLKHLNSQELTKDVNLDALKHALVFKSEHLIECMKVIEKQRGYGQLKYKKTGSKNFVKYCFTSGICVKAVISFNMDKGDEEIEFEGTALPFYDTSKGKNKN